MKPYKKHRPEDIWITKEGQEIPVPLLEDSHLLNCICMLYRKAVDLRGLPDIAWRMDRLTIEEILGGMDHYRVLTAEASRRGLDWQERVSKLNPVNQYLEMFL